MKFGTPLSPGATRVMLLGCGELGKEVIIALQRLGVEVIGVDRYADAPGQQVAHRAHVIDMTDGAALRRLVEQERPHIILPEIEAIATDALAAIEADGLARVVPNARAVQLTMNREGMRRLAALPHANAKLSGPGMVMVEWTVETFAPFIHETIDMFGPSRCMFASNVPPDALHKTFDDIYTGFYAWAAQYSVSEQQEMFHDTAARVYRL